MRHPLVFVAALFLFCSCKKNNTDNNIVGTRTTNVFGMSLPSSYDRITRLSFTNSDTSELFTYNSDGQITKITEQIGTGNSSDLFFNYDSQGRLSSMHDEDAVYSLEYGSGNR